MLFTSKGFLHLYFKILERKKMKNLYELTEDASSSLNIYKNPNIDEWKEEIDKVLEELGEATIGYDKVENIHFDKNDIRITTSYSVRCCPCSNDMTIPLEVLLDKEPIKKAKYVYQQKELEKAEYQVKRATEELNKSLVKLEEIKQLIKGE